MQMNLGRSIEDVIENLCSRSFFADFTIRSPKYSKAGGLEKEAADVLVVFNETLLAIQVKSKDACSSASQNDVERTRISRAIENAIRQFRALGEAWHDPDFNSFTNGRGVKVAFHKGQIKDVIFIVVFVPVWKDKPDSPPRVQFNLTCYPDGPIAIHVFSLDQFSLLLIMLNTLPDFLLYLDGRWVLHGEKLVPKDSDPLDEWALMTFERNRFIEIIEKRISTDISGLFNRHRLSVERLERQEKPSYFVDNLIESLCKAVGAVAPVDPRFKLLAEPNSLKAYQMTIPYFAKLKRDQRAKLVEFLINRVKESEKNGFAFRAFKFKEESEEAYFVLAAKALRDERRMGLVNLAKIAGIKLRVKTVIGIAVGHDWPASPNSDVAIVDVSNLHDRNLNQATEDPFGRVRRPKK